MSGKCIVTFSFDDAREDSYRAIKIALEHGIKSTLNVTTGYVNGSISPEDKPCDLPAMSIDQILELNRHGIEIACHGYKHNNDFDNLIKGKIQLLEWIGSDGEHDIGVASPHSKFDISPSGLDFVTDNFAYLRVGGFIGGLNRKDRIFQKVARITKSNYLFVHVYKKTVRGTISSFPILRCVPVLKGNSVSQIMKLLKYCAKHNLWCILGFHSVLDVNEEGYHNNFSWDINKFIKLCECIQKDDSIYPKTTMEYVKEEMEKTKK